MLAIIESLTNSRKIPYNITTRKGTLFITEIPKGNILKVTWNNLN